MLMLVWVAGGAACLPHRKVTDLNRPPIVLQGTPDLDQLIAAVNRTDVIEKMQSSSTQVAPSDTGMMLPDLRATLAVHRPRGLRMRASMPFGFSSGLDLGSNDDVFWVRYPENMQQTLLFARHDEYQQVMLEAPVPVPPNWIIEALGLVHIDPKLVVDGPNVRADGQLELRTIIPTPSGPFTRVLFIDAQGGYVTEQYVYAPTGRLVATAVGSDHRFYETENVVMPHKVRVQLEPISAPPISLKVEIGSYALNQFLGDDPNMFTMPRDESDQVIDLGRMGPVLPPANLNQPAPPESNYVPTASYQPAYRGTQMR